MRHASPHRALGRLAASLLLSLGFVAGCRSGGAAAPVAPLTDEQRQLNVASFDQVWTTVRDKHFDPTFNGVDWNAVRDELRPRAEQADSTEEARAAMGEMLGRLGQTHFGIIPAEAYQDVTGDEPAAAESGTPGSTGMTLALVDDEVLVRAVEADSAADRAGVQPGWRILRVGTTDVDDLLRRVDAAYADSHMRAAMRHSAVLARIGGDAGQSRRITFETGRGRAARTIDLLPRTGSPARFGNLPTFYVQYESKRLDGDIGYIRLNAFFDSANVMRQFGESIESFRDTRGLVIDLRGNPGGLGPMAMGMGSWLVSAPNQKLGTMQARTMNLNFVLNPRPRPYTEPVAILVDEMSMSTSEILAGGLQDIGRGRVFGSPTPGAALPSTVEKLPNGDGFQYAFANYVSAGGKVLEGHGVVPDETVRQDREALLAGRDAVLDAATRWILGHSMQ